jgi:hypothetical protein
LEEGVIELTQRGQGGDEQKEDHEREGGQECHDVTVLEHPPQERDVTDENVDDLTVTTSRKPSFSEIGDHHHEEHVGIYQDKASDVPRTEHERREDCLYFNIFSL